VIHGFSYDIGLTKDWISIWSLLLFQNAGNDNLYKRI